MGSSERVFNRVRTVHQILGGGIVADVILWRRNNLTIGILGVTLAAWLVFEKSGYTLISLASNVLLLLFAILFLWAKAAAILNRVPIKVFNSWLYGVLGSDNKSTRPSPSLPDLYLSEEIVNDVAAFIRNRTNALLSAAKDIALGKDTTMFFKLAIYLLLFSIIGGLTDFLTLAYTGLVIVLTIPALYEKYEDYIDTYILTGFGKLQQLYVRFDVEFLGRVQKWILENKKLS